MAALVLKEGPPESVGMDPARVTRIRELASGWVRSGDVPSMVALVARHGTIVLHEAFGVRHYEDVTPTLRTSSIFPTASCSKPITAAVVMCLVEDGRIGLNRSFVEYVPELDVPGMQWLAEASVADLLRHTSGIEDLRCEEVIDAASTKSTDLPPPGAGQHATLHRRIRLAAGAPLARQPGSAMIYSNFGYQLLGDIVRRVSGQPFWQFASTRLFQPLGLHDSFYRLPPDLRDRRVYRRPGLPGTKPPPFLPGAYGGCDSCDSPEHDDLDLGNNGVASTARDLAVFLQMLLNAGSYGGRRILSPASVAAMTRPQVDASRPHLQMFLHPATGKRVELEYKGGSYGYGLFLFDGNSRFAINGSLTSPFAFGHSGYYGAYMWADPEYGLVGVCLAVPTRIKRGHPDWNSDLFVNAVYGAVAD